MQSFTNFDLAINSIADNGYVVMEQFLPDGLIQDLAAEAQALKLANCMKQASVSQHKITNNSMRGDLIFWLNDQQCSQTQQAYLDSMKTLLEIFNREFYLGLTEFESHFAVYPTGTHYQKHLDQFKEQNHRKISAVLYLNQDWQVEDGGALRLYLDDPAVAPYQDILPIAGKLVLFDSARFWHEVLPARRERSSITGWFRSRPDSLL